MAINSSFRTLTADSFEGVVYNTNYLSNGFENGTVTGWNKFSVSVQSNLPSGLPTIGTASSITFFDVDPNVPQYEKYSLLVEANGVPWSAGDGFISDVFTLQKNDVDKPLVAYFDYKIFIGASNINFSGNLNSQTFAIFIYNETQATWVQPVGFLGFVNSLDCERMTIRFNSSNSENDEYRIAFLCINSTPGTEAVALLFDNFTLTRDNTLNTGGEYATEVPIINNQSSFTNTDVFVDIYNSSGFTIDYSVKRKFNPLSLQVNNSFIANNFNALLFDINSQQDGKLLIGGSFSNYSGVSGTNYFVRVDENGVIDNAFCANAVNGNLFNSSVLKIAVQPDGKILVGGLFTNYKTVGRDFLIRLNPNGTLDNNFCVNASNGSKFNGVVRDIVIQSNGQILVAGDFTNYGGILNRNYLIRLNADGTLDETFCINASDNGKFNSSVFSIKAQSDGKIVAGGSFTEYGTISGRNFLIRLNADGTTDTGFSGFVDGKVPFTVLIVCIQPSDGKILVGGAFNSYGGTASRNKLVRLETSGDVDLGFCAAAVDGAKFNNTIRSISIQPDNKILVAGDFTNYGNPSFTGRNRVIRLDSLGDLDTTFCNQFIDGPKISDSVRTVFANSSYSVYFGGSFTLYNSVYSYFAPLTLQPNGAPVSQIETGRLKGHINLNGSITSSNAYSPLGSGGVSLQVNNGTGNIQYTSDNLYPYPTYGLDYGSLNLLVKNL